MVGLYCRNAIENNWFYWFAWMPFGSVEGVRRMMHTSTAILFVGAFIIIMMGVCDPKPYNYHDELRLIAYQLSRIADALDRSKNNDSD